MDALGFLLAVALWLRRAEWFCCVDCGCMFQCRRRQPDYCPWCEGVDREVA